MFFEMDIDIKYKLIDSIEKLDIYQVVVFQQYNLSAELGIWGFLFCSVVPNVIPSQSHYKNLF